MKSKFVDLKGRRSVEFLRHSRDKDMTPTREQFVETLEPSVKRAVIALIGNGEHTFLPIYIARLSELLRKTNEIGKR